VCGALNTPHSRTAVGWGKGKVRSWVAAGPADKNRSGGHSAGGRGGKVFRSSRSQFSRSIRHASPAAELGVKTLARSSRSGGSVGSQFGRAAVSAVAARGGSWRSLWWGWSCPSRSWPPSRFSLRSATGPARPPPHPPPPPTHMDKLIDRALADRARSGWGCGGARAQPSASTGASGSWKRPSGPSATRSDRGALRHNSKRSPHAERWSVRRRVQRLRAGTTEMQLFARDAAAAARTGRRRALQRDDALRSASDPDGRCCIKSSKSASQVPTPERRYALTPSNPEHSVPR